MTTPFEFFVSDLNGKDKEVRVLKFTYHRGYQKTLTQPGESDFLEDVEVEWADTGKLLTDTEWQQYEDQIMETLYKELV